MSPPDQERQPVGSAERPKADAADDGLAWTRDPAYRATLDLLKASLDALERVRTANSDDARRLAHEETMANFAQLDAVTGRRSFEDQRVVSSAAGQPAHRPPSTSKGLDAIFRRRGGNPTERRYATARILFDRLRQEAGPEVLRLVLADMGYPLPEEPAPIERQPTGLRAATLRQGVKPLGGPVAAIKLGLVNVIGYTLGVEGQRDCAPRVWTARAILHLRVKTKSRTPGINLDEIARVVANAWADIEHETKDREPGAEPDMRGDLSLRAVFRSAWRRGDADRQNGTCDKTLMLQRK